MTTLKYDYCVIGGGIVGTSAAYYLSRHLKGEKSIVLLEQDTISSKKASSYGSSRMYREMYSCPFYSRLMTSSLTLWHEIERRSGRQLLTDNGLLFFGSDAMEETVEGSISGAKKTMIELGLDYSAYNDSKNLKHRWPELTPQTNDVAIFSPNDGMINATLACHALAHLAQTAGVKMMQGIEVAKMNSSSKEVLTLSLSNGDKITTNHLIIATGCWTQENLLKWFNLSLNLEIHSVIWGYYDVSTKQCRIPQWFCFRESTHTGIYPECHGLYYGFPVETSPYGTNSKLMAKIGIDFTPLGKIHRPKTMSEFNYTPEQALVDDLNSFVKAHWPSLGENIALYASPYNMTQDNDFVLGLLPNHSNVAVFCGGNGRAFKFGPMLGKLLVDLMTRQSIDIDLSRFSPTRLCTKR